MTKQDLANYGQSTINAGSKSFAKAAMLFDRETGHSVKLLYAWCRHCDDEIDGQTLGRGLLILSKTEQIQSLQSLETQTADAFAKNPCAHPAFSALAYVAEKHNISEHHAHELLRGFALDVADSRFETIDDTLNYCYHVAGVVGIMMAQIMGVTDKPTLLRACDLGIAFQLTNIARDVMDDIAIGRCYLPQQWLKTAGMTESDINLSEYRTVLHALVQDLLKVADNYYASAHYGIAHLPMRSAWAIASALLIYRDIGVQIKTATDNAWLTRAHTSKAKKISLIGQGYLIATQAKLLERNREEPPRIGLWTKMH